jgi:FkbH-like protein
MKDFLKTEDILALIKKYQISAAEGLQLLKGLKHDNSDEAEPDKKENWHETAHPASTANLQFQPIAIIGMSGKFPDANDVNEYWENLSKGKDSVTEIPKSRWSLDNFYDPNVGVPHRSYSKWGGFLSDIEMFDPLFFSISPKEAELMDPQHRLFLQEAWQALEDAGYSPQQLEKQKCGVFVGCWDGDYRDNLTENQVVPDAYYFTGNAAPILAARISYFLNLTGPNIAINTACSASLVAIHLACENIWNGTTTLALAGGVTIQTTKEYHILASQAEMLSKDGKCYTFDNRANGFVPSEGVGVVILKSLATAKRDGDHIYGIIKGSGINQDGKTNGITAPSAPSQTALECEVYNQSDIHPETISYVEAHGTGTKLGDPIEIQALTDAFKKYINQKQYCAIGSVKTNIGHTQLAAGMAGLIKILLCLKHKKLVPSLHFETANEHINLKDSPFYVNTELKEWKTKNSIPRRAALSAFGFSGTNAHLVIEEYENPQSSLLSSQVHQIIVLSAKNEERLQAYAKKIINFLSTVSTTEITPAPLVDKALSLQAVQQHLLKIASEILKVSDNEINLETELSEYGFDTVSLTALMTQLNDKYQLDITPTFLSEQASLGALAHYLAEHSHEQSCSKTNNSTLELSAKWSLTDMAYTLQVGRDSMEERLAMVVNNLDEVKNKLTQYVQGQTRITGFYQGNVKNRSTQSDLLIEGEEGRDFIKSIILNRKLAKLAQLWVSGLEIDWPLLYGKQKPQRISLPTYPFARERYWIPLSETKPQSFNGEGQVAKLHPLLGSNTSTLTEQKFTTPLTGKEFYLTDHVIGKQKTLPGVAYLEMARAAFALASEQPAMKLTNIVWAKPIIVSDCTIPVDITLSPIEQQIEFEVSTIDDNEHRQVHVQGRLTAVSQANINKSELIDIAAIKNRCVETLDGPECYKLFRAKNLDYGPLFQTIQTLYCNDNEALSHLQLPARLVDRFNDFVLHPSLMDGALQTVAGFMGQTTDNTPYIVFALGEMELLGPLSKNCYVYVRCVDGSRADASAVKKFNLSILDETGQEQVRLKDLSGRALKQDNETSVTRYYQNVWDPAKLETQTEIPIGTVLLFDTDVHRHLSFKEYLKSKVILVILGKNYQVLGPDSYSINPNQLADYQKLLAALSDKKSDQKNCLPSHIIHLWSQVPFVNNEVALNAQLSRGLFSILYLSQALLEQKPHNQIQLLYIYLETKEALQPQYAALSGFAKSISLENPKLACKTIALPSLDQVVTIIGSEFQTSAPEVRYWEGQRWVKQLQEFDPTHETHTTTLLKEHGVYLITGGAGGLGLIFAEYLAKHFKAKLVLTGRSKLNKKQIDNIQRMNDLGAQVIYQQADISKSEAVRKLIAEIKSRFNEINGIIHSAGVLKDTLILNKNVDEMAAVLAPKVYGTIHLDEATQNEPLDFFVLFSSVSATFGNVGQCDYAYANSFMDNFALWRSEQHLVQKRFGKTLSINWPLWQSGGMQVDENLKTWLKQVMGLVPLSTETGLQAFEAGLRLPYSQMVVIEGFAAKLKSLGNAATLSKTQPDQQAKPTQTAPSRTVTINESLLPQLQEPTEQYLKEILSQEIKLSKTAIYAQEPLEKYGLDSVMVMSLTRQLEKDFGELSKTLLFEYQTLKELANYFIQHHRERLLEKLKLNTQPATSEAKTTDIETIGLEVDETAELMRLTTHSRFMAPTVLKSDETAVSEDIAIIGISGQYPMAPDLNAFWNNLVAGKDCITEIPQDRWDHNLYYDPSKKAGRIYNKWGGFVDDVDKFDPLFFNISPREAELTDPQERMFLETVWHTLEDAGYTRTNFWQKPVGVFVGVMWSEYQLFGAEESLKGNPTAPSSFYASIANRISYYFNFTGPSIAVDTMCSSSLTAIHLACESIKREESEIAIAGGVNASLHPQKYFQLSMGKFASSDGRCRSFGEGGDGYVPGEGVGAVLLKPLNRAIEEGDIIYGVIKGSSINAGGKTSGYTVPNPNAQAQLIGTALKKAQINPRTLSYVEAHGTGTSLGDPIEITGLMKAYQTYTTDKQYCPIGSVKSNIGHLESAAGIAGLTKVLLQMKYQQLVPSIHSEHLNPHINFKASPFYVQQTLAEWKQPVIFENGEEKRYPRRAGISSFGAGGANAHLILEEYELPLAKADICNQEPQLIVLSAKNEERLQAYIQKIIDFLNPLLPLDMGHVVEKNEVTSIQQIQANLLKLASKILKVSDNEIELDEPFSEYGFDTVSLTELSHRLNDQYLVSITPALLSEYSSLAAVAQYLCDNSQEQAISMPAGKKTNFSLAEFAYTLQVGREAMEERLAMVVSDLNEVKNKLTQYTQGQTEITDFYRSNVKTRLAQLDLLIEGEIGEAFLKMVIEKKDLTKLAQLWISGVDINWPWLYPTQKPRRISLPTYPFAKKRYWIPVSDFKPVETQIARLHPLLESNTSTLHEQKFTTKMTGDEFYLADHIVGSQKMLPGVAILEMARAAGELSAEKIVTRITNVVWAKPITMSDTPITVQISLYPVGEQVEFTVFTIDEQRQSHAYGKLNYESLTGAKRLDIKAIQNRCLEVWDDAKCYQLFQSVGLNYGPSFKPIQVLYRNDSEALSRLFIPATLTDNHFSALVLHPSLMDGALQTVIGLRGQTTDKTSYIPFALGEVELLGPLSAQSYVYACLANNADTDSTFKFNISILDETGEVRVRLSDFSVRALKSQTETSVTWYYRTVWESSKFSPPTQTLTLGTVLLFDTDDNRYSSLKKRLKGEVILVMPGESYQALDSQTYLINPKQFADYQKLLFTLNQRDFKLPSHIIHLWSQLPFVNEKAALNTQLEMGLFSIFYLTQALSAQKPSIPIQLLYVYLETPEALQPQYAALSGFVKTIRLENPKLNYKMVALSHLGQVTDTVLTEFQASEGVEIRYGESQRWVKRLQEFDQATAATTTTLLKENGVYLITGGTGGLGFIFAEYLTKQVQAKLVLTGRSALSEKQAAKIQLLNSLGAEAIYLQADVSKRDEVATLIAQAKARFHEINGIIHSAGIIKDALVTKKTSNEMAAVLAPKVDGTVWLDELTQNEQLDFLVLFSSAAAVTGNVGQCDYAYANSFMDNFAVWREELRANNKRAGKTLSINWPLWQSGGMQVDEQTLKWLTNTMGIQALATETGLEAFSQGLTWKEISQFMVLSGHRQKIKKGLGLEEIAVPSTTVVSKVAAEKDQLLEQVQKDLLTMAGAILKLGAQDIKVTDEISQYGFDSIILMELTNQINEKYRLEVTPTILIEHTSIAAFSEILCSKYQKQFLEYYQDHFKVVTTPSSMEMEMTMEMATTNFEPLKVKNRFIEPSTILPNSPVDTPIEKAEKNGYLPVSIEQERMWIVEQFKLTGTAPNLMTMGFQLTGQLNITALEQSLNEIVQRHDVLRTTFAMVDGFPVQNITPHLSLTLRVDDYQQIDKSERHSLITKIADEEARRPFELNQGPLWRFKLMQLGKSDYLLLFITHHIIFDALSVAFFLRELAILYEAFCLEKTSPLPKILFQYGDFAVWQRQWLQSQSLAKPLAFWKKQLEGAPPLLKLPTDRPRPLLQSFQTAHKPFKFSEELSKALVKFSEQQNMTLFTTLMTGFKTLLYQYSKLEDLLVGFLYSGRVRSEVEFLIGSFAYPLVLRIQLSGNPSFRELLAQVGKTLLETSAHKVPFGKVVEAVAPERSPQYNPLIQVVFTFMGDFDDINFPSLTLKPIEEIFQAPTEVDLTLRMSRSCGVLQGDMSYQTDLFDANTITFLINSYTQILEQAVQSPETKITEFQLANRPSVNNRSLEKQPKLAISATFTAEPVADSINFWLQEFELGYQIEFAPYNQVFQQLLNPESLLAQNLDGINLILVRFEDWIRFESTAEADNFYQQIERNVQELIQALKESATRFSCPHLVALCPSAPETLADQERVAFLQRMETQMVSELAESSGVYLITTAALNTSYPVAKFYHPDGDQAGHIPFTPLFFTALGTMLTRKIYAILQTPYKVIVLDCDQTLWQGICGEDGVDGIVVTPAHQALQEFMIAQHDKGMLLCLCSKNNEEDVIQVFEQYSGMSLQLHHLVSWRINWKPKSENLYSLSQELQLGLDSFIFIDDNPVECAEVQANCPTVLSLQLPENLESIPRFLQHLWAFDRLKVTAEDQQRTVSYQLNRKREQLREKSLTLGDFLNSLELQVQITEIVASQFSRVAQLAQRTNQFNATTIRRTENEIQNLFQTGEYTCLVVNVTDRFGDYGLVGVIIFTTTMNSLKIDTFLLSCRVLGRGVEHQMLAKLGEIAQQHKLDWVEVIYQPTAKNKPILSFLESVGADFQESKEKNQHFKFPADFCKNIIYAHLKTTLNEKNELPTQSSASTQVGNLANSELLSRIATQLYDPEQILQRLESKIFDLQLERQQPFVAPRTETETQLVDLWRKTLHLEKISIYDNFFEIGGNSLLAVQLMFYVRETFQIELPLNQLLNVPTITDLARLIESKSSPKAHTQSTSTVDSVAEMQVESIKPLIYLLSTPRAGSTLLRVMLMGHSQIFAPPELHLLPFDSLKQRAEVLTNFNNEFLKIGLIETIQMLENLSSTKAFDKMRALEEQDLSIEETYQLLQKYVGDCYLVDKSPSYAVELAVLERAERLSKEPFYLFLVRHPLSVMESFVRNRFDKLLDIQEDPWHYAEDLWVKYNTNLLTFLAKIPQHRQFLIQYEELVQYPEKVMKGLCSQLGIAFEVSMLTPYEGDRMTKGLFEGTLSCGDPNFAQHQKIDASLAQAWKQHTEKLKQLRPQTVKLAHKLGYSVEIPKEYGLSPAQTAFMNLFGTEPVWHIVQHLQITEPEFQVKRFEQSLQKLIDNHAVLRFSFLRKEGVWVQQEHEKVSIAVGYEDLSVSDDKTIQQRVLEIEQTLNNQLQIHAPPLLACTVAAIKPGQYRVIMVIHHLIADGVSLSLMHREWFDIYQNPDKQSLKENKLSYADYVTEMNWLEKSTPIKTHLAFWQAQIRSMEMVCPTDYQKGPNNIASQETYETIQSWLDLGIDISKVKSQLFDYIVVGLYQCLATWTNHKMPVITHRLHRRNMDLQEQYTEVVGWFAGDIPLSLNVEQAVSEQIVNLQKQLREVPMGGVTYEILTNQGLLPPAYEVGPIRLNYQPVSLMPLLKNVELASHLFESPTHDRLYWLDIVMRVNQAHFQVILRYSKNLHNQNTIEKLVQEWLLLIKGVILKSINQ